MAAIGARSTTCLRWMRLLYPPSLSPNATLYRTAIGHRTLACYSLSVPENRKQLLQVENVYLLPDRTKKDKAKPKKSDKGKKHAKPRVDLTSEELNEVVNYDKMVHFMEMAVEQLQKDLVDQFTVRTSRGVFDNLTVETPDGKFPLIQLGQIVYKNPQLVTINMASVPQYIPAVMAALINTGMNLNPQQQSTTVLVPIPKVTREHRESLAKGAKALLNETKDKLRNTQNKFLRDAKKAEGDHGYDLVHNVQETIQAATQRYISQAEQMTEAKQNEILNK